MLAVVAFISLSVCAQEKYDPRTNGNIIFKAVGTTWQLKDRIILDNRSPYMILQVVVAEVVNHELRPLGTCNNVSTMDKCEVATFPRNGLKDLRGKTIAIKAKGVMSKDADGSTGANQDVTYEFDARLYPYSNDLYIELFSATKQGSGIMDF